MTPLSQATETTLSTPWGCGLQRHRASLTWKTVCILAESTYFQKYICQIRISNNLNNCLFLLVNVGGYIQAVLDRNLAENISRVLYPNDNVRKWLYYHLIHRHCTHSPSIQILTWIRGTRRMWISKGSVCDWLDLILAQLGDGLP